MWKGELAEVLVMKGYSIIVGAKPLQPIDETFCSFPTEDDNCKNLDCQNLWTSAVQRKPKKR